MADNVELNAGTGGAVVATDDITSVHYQIVKVAHGALDTGTLVTASTPLPVTDADVTTAVEAIQASVAGTLTVDGDVAHGAADANAPVKVGGYADSGPPTPVDIADRANTWLGLNGQVVVAGRDVTPADDQTNIGQGLPALTNGTARHLLTMPYMFDGTTWDRLRGDSTDGLLVNLGGNNDVTVTGTVGLGATDNAVLDDIAAKLGTIDADTGAIATDAAAIEVLLTGIDADTDAIKTAVELIDNAISGSEMQVDIVAALPAGTNAIGKLAANSGVDIGDVDVTSISAGTNTIGNMGLIGRTSGGMTIFRSIDLDESEEEVKSSAGQVFSISAFNRTAAPLYLKFYNATAANVTVGTTTPVLTFVVPANADSDGAGFIWNNEIGFAFGTAISVACTTGVADNDTGAPGANDCIVNIGYA